MERTKKRILISVTLALLVLEVGFGVYLAFERKYEYALSKLSLPVDSVKEIQTDTDREFEIASLFSAEEPFPDNQRSVATKKPDARAVTLRNPRATSAASPLAVNPRTKRPVATAPAIPVVAQKQNKSGTQAPIYSASRNETPRSDDKSLIAKSISTLKKPFGWMKTVVSKLR